MAAKKTLSTSKPVVPAATGHVPATKRAATRRAADVSTKARQGRVLEVTAAGGYRAFTSPVGPVHRTRSEIAAAVADLD